jgi:hypothetical protein
LAGLDPAIHASPEPSAKMWMRGSSPRKGTPPPAHRCSARVGGDSRDRRQMIFLCRKSSISAGV